MSRRSEEDHARAKAVAAQLRVMFRKLQARPVPDRLRSVVDQLDEGEAPMPKVAQRI